MPRHSEGWFLLKFLVLFTPGSILAFLFGKGEAHAVVTFMEAVVVISAAASFVIVEGTVLLSERYLRCGRPGCGTGRGVVTRRKNRAWSLRSHRRRGLSRKSI